MDNGALTPNSWELVIPEEMYDRLHAHLFPGDHDEHGAIIRAGIARSPDGNLRLLARNLHLARDGKDFVYAKQAYKMFRAEFVRDQMMACCDERLVYLNIHNHGSDNSVHFSVDDLNSHERGYPALLDIAEDLPVGALVFGSRAIAGELWLQCGKRINLKQTVVVGQRRRVFTPSPTAAHRSTNNLVYDRQTRLFGEVGQDILKKSKIAIIGVGGVGALLIEWLARLGVGSFILIEPERIELSNLSRFPGATRLDALAWLCNPKSPAWMQNLARRLSARKLRIAERVIRRANRGAHIEKHVADFLEPHVASSVLDCDYLFLAADTMRARLLFNAIVHQYLIPGVQIGSKISADMTNGHIENVHSIVRPVTPDHGCLMCNQLINASTLQDEGKTTQERHAQKYIDDVEIASPSVITLNTTAASQAANDFMLYMTGLTAKESNKGYMRFMPLTREVFIDATRKSESCSECGGSGKTRLGRGDLGPRLPTYYKPLFD